MAELYQFSVPDLSSCCAGRLEETLQGACPPPEWEVKVRASALRRTVSVRVIKKPVAYQQDGEAHRFFHAQLIKAGYSIPLLPHWLHGLGGVVLGLGLMLFCIFSGVGFGVMALLGLMAMGITLWSGWPFFKRAYRALSSSKPFTMDTLFVLSTGISLVVSVCALFIPGLPLMFEVGLFIFGFRHIGLAIEDWVINQMTHEETFRDQLSDTVVILPSKERKRLEDVQPGDRVLIEPGALIPFNGKILTVGAEGRTTCLDGEISAKPLAQGLSLRAGVQLTLGSAPVELEVEQSYQDSYLAQMDKIIEQNLAQPRKSKIEEKVSKILVYFVPVVLFVACVSAVVVGLFFGWVAALLWGAGIVASACPCVLGFVVPLAMKIGVIKAKRYGVCVMHEEALERAAEVKAVMFDWSGTVTQGKLSVQAIQWHVADKQEALLGAIERAAMAVQGSNHAIAEAISQACQGDGRSLTGAPIMHPGGLCMEIEGKLYWVGSRACLTKVGIVLPAPLGAAGEEELFFSCGDQLLATIKVRDPLRSEAEETIRQLQAQGKEIYFCTGGGGVSARAFARSLGIPETHVRMNCTPEEKASWVDELEKTEGCLACVGEGGNDALMLSKPTVVGIAMSSTAHRTALSTASVHIGGDSLRPLQYLFPVATQTLRLVHGSLGASLVYNILSMVLAGGVLLMMGVTMLPAIGALLMMLQVCLLLGGMYGVHKMPISLKDLPPVAPMEASGHNGADHTPAETPRFEQPWVGPEAEPGMKGVVPAV